MAEQRIHRRRVLVRGGGIVGKVLAMLLAQDGIDVVLVERLKAKQFGDDARAYALNAASVGLLQSLRSWPQEVACPVYDMEVAGDAHGVLRFTAWQEAVDSLAYIVPATAVEQALDLALAYQPRIERLVVDAQTVLPGVDVTVVCEGRDSQTRSQFGFEMDVRSYGHVALAARVRCERGHAHVARQWFSGKDVLALLPLVSQVKHQEEQEGQEVQDRQGGAQGQHEVSMVWSMPEAQAKVLQGLDTADFEAALCAAAHSVLGSMQLLGSVARWDLRFACAKRWFVCKDGETVVLAGDAAHVMHPLAGQGLNVGLADVVELARVWREAPAWRPLDDERLLRGYERVRRADFVKIGGGCDVLFNLFMNASGSVGVARNCAMSILDVVGPLKSWLVRQARRGE